MVIVEGEPGIGKTTLVRRFIGDLPTGAFRLFCDGVEESDGAEPYLPLLTAIDRLAFGREEAAATLARHAPAWVPHVPSLSRLGGQSSPALGPDRTTTATRMLREMAGALEILSELEPVLLVARSALGRRRDDRPAPDARARQWAGAHPDPRNVPTG
jgi:hypothetical protein